MDERERRLLLLQPFVAPLAQRGHNREEVTTAVGEPVFMAQGPNLVGNSIQDPGADQAIKALGEDITSHAQASVKLLKSIRPEEGLIDDQQGPPFTQLIQRPGHAAGRVRKAHSSHNVALCNAPNRFHHTDYGQFYVATVMSGTLARL